MHECTGYACIGELNLELWYVVLHANGEQKCLLASLEVYPTCVLTNYVFSGGQHLFFFLICTPKYLLHPVSGKD